MNPMEGIGIPTSSQSPTNLPSTNDVLDEEDMEIFQDVKYREGYTRETHFLQSCSEVDPVVQEQKRTPRFS